MADNYDLLQSISQRENGTMPQENEDLVHIADDIRRAACRSGANESQSSASNINVTNINELEKRAAEDWAKSNGCWIPMADIFDLGLPGPSGSESDTFLTKEGIIYKMNNLLHCQDSIVSALLRFALFNILFPDTAYSFVGFAGFDGRSVYPIVKQNFIKDCTPATQNEVDCYMAAIGFEKIEAGKYKNQEFLVSDILPKNVLKDPTGDLFVIDAEIRLME